MNNTGIEVTAPEQNLWCFKVLLANVYFLHTSNIALFLLC